MNLIVLIGRITGADKVRVGEHDGRHVLNFDIAVNWYQGNNEKTAYFKCSHWTPKPSNVAQYLTRGKQVAVHGEVSLETRDHASKTYTDLAVNVRNLELIGNRDDAAPGELPVSDFLQA
jgi:single-stranded DNA-binding protein